MNLERGENKIRILSEFEDYGTHYDNKKSVVCLGKDKCSYCQNGERAKVQYLGWVIDRKDGEIKLLRFGSSVSKQITELARSDEYGFDSVPDYDLTIKKTGEGLETEYVVIPARKSTVLTEDEKVRYLDKFKSPKDIIEKMKEKVERICSDKEAMREEIDEEIEDEDIPR
jgi:hypothetical protein